MKRGALGDRLDPKNPFQWKKVVENYPGTQDYNPTLPWIRKVREDGLTAADLHDYVDDLRVTAPTEDVAWECSSQIGKEATHKGLQDALRKRRKPSQEPGAWAGAVV